MLLGGLDIGTSSCKLTIFDSTTKESIVYSEQYKNIINDKIHEINPIVIKDAVFKVLVKANDHPISGLGVTSFGETFVLLDANDNVLCNSILYTDHRGVKQLKYLINKLGIKKIKAITGLYPHQMYSISKLLWIRDNAREIFNKVDKVFLIQDYIVYLLTGKRNIDYSLASRTMCFDINSLQWSKEILDVAKLPMSLFSNTVPIGTISENDARTIKVVSAGHDQISALLGAGALNIGDTVDGAGTVQCMSYIVSKTVKDSFDFGKYCFTPYIFPNTYVLFAFTYAGGALFSWIKDLFNVSFNELESKDAPTKLLFLPYILGAGTPFMDSNAKGVIMGLTSYTNKQDIFRAAMEGLAFEMKLNEELLNKKGVSSKTIFATGRANTQMFLQIKANILEKEYLTFKTKDAGTIGCIIVTAKALGLYKDYFESYKHFTEEDKIIKKSGNNKSYLKKYRKYKKLYKSIKNLY